MSKKISDLDFPRQYYNDLAETCKALFYPIKRTEFTREQSLNAFRMQVKEIRVARGWRHKDLAERLAVSSARLSSMMRYPTTIKALSRIAIALDVMLQVKLVPASEVLEPVAVVGFRPFNEELIMYKTYNPESEGYDILHEILVRVEKKLVKDPWGASGQLLVKS